MKKGPPKYGVDEFDGVPNYVRSYVKPYVCEVCFLNFPHTISLLRIMKCSFVEASGSPLSLLAFFCTVDSTN